MTATRSVLPVGFNDKLTIVEHLTELRTRIIVCLVVFVAATGFFLWQSHPLLDLLNRPLNQSALTAGSSRALATGAADKRLTPLLRQQASVYRSLAANERDATLRSQLGALAAESMKIANAPAARPSWRPVTLGVGEPFSVSFKVAAYAALLLSLPLLLYEAYAYVLPALSPRERSVALPVLLAVPVLFLAGVAFCYELVLPAAVRFLLGFNAESFQTLLQARDYYRFAIMLMGSMGLLFQIPIGVLAANRAGIVSVRQLRRGRRYALLAVAVIAMVLPGQDPVTMLLMMAPMYGLYEASIVCAALLSRRRKTAAS